MNRNIFDDAGVRDAFGPVLSDMAAVLVDRGYDEDAVLDAMRSYEGILWDEIAGPAVDALEKVLELDICLHDGVEDASKCSKAGDVNEDPNGESVRVDDVNTTLKLELALLDNTLRLELGLLDDTLGRIAAALERIANRLDAGIYTITTIDSP